MNYPFEVGFDTDVYLLNQVEAISTVVNDSSERLYIEFGGKLIQDRHSARVLPGYREDAKFELIQKLLRHAEVIFVVSAKDIQRGRVRGDFGTTYDQESLRMVQELKKRGLIIDHLVISLLEQGKPIPILIENFAKKVKKQKIAVNYFLNLSSYNSKDFDIDELELNPFINVNKSLVLIISPGGGSGKFGICLNQLFYEMKQGSSPRYLKYETFPVYNLALTHPLNLAYMAASADFYDVVMKDRRRKGASSYNRDLENYELLRVLAAYFPKEGKYLRKISSATNMGINMLSKGIINDEIIQKEAAAEIARRLVRYKFEVERGQEDEKVLERVRKIIAML